MKTPFPSPGGTPRNVTGISNTGHEGFSGNNIYWHDGNDSADSHSQAEP
jgi:hypothetical protein